MPLHSGHAPYGELKENVRGSRSSSESGWPLGQAIRSEKRTLAVRVVVGQVDEVEHDQPVGEPERGLHRVGEPLLGRILDREPVDHHGDVVLLLLLELGRIGERVDRAVDHHARVALRLQVGEQVDELALAGAHHRRQHLEPAALLHGEDLVDDLLRGLLLDDVPAHRAVRHAGPRVEQAQVVVDLGDGADRGPRVAVGGLLVDRDGGRQALDEVDVGLVHLAEELPRVRGERLDVPALPLGEDGVEGQAGLARPGQAGEHHEAVARQVEVDAAEVVLAGAAYYQTVGHGGEPPETRVAGRAWPSIHARRGHRQNRRCGPASGIPGEPGATTRIAHTFEHRLTGAARPHALPLGSRTPSTTVDDVRERERVAPAEKGGAGPAEPRRPAPRRLTHPASAHATRRPGASAQSGCASRDGEPASGTGRVAC